MLFRSHLLSLMNYSTKSHTSSTRSAPARVRSVQFLFFPSASPPHVRRYLLSVCVEAVAAALLVLFCLVFCYARITHLYQRIGNSSSGGTVSHCTDEMSFGTRVMTMTQVTEFVLLSNDERWQTNEAQQIRGTGRKEARRARAPQRASKLRRPTNLRVRRKLESIDRKSVV